MDYEKKYKEALERATTLYENANGMILKKWVEKVFPELAESEDEKIRKELIKVFSNREKYLIDQLFGDVTVSEVLAWLEKQGTSYTKRDVDDAFVEGMAFAKNELEKQGEQKSIDYDEELRKCRENPLYFFDKYVKIKERKPAWSEEDEVRLQACLDTLQVKSLMGKVDTVMTDWLKSLKQRLKGE